MNRGKTILRPVSGQRNETTPSPPASSPGESATPASGSLRPGQFTIYKIFSESPVTRTPVAPVKPSRPYRRLWLWALLVGLGGAGVAVVTWESRARPLLARKAPTPSTAPASPLVIPQTLGLRIIETTPPRVPSAKILMAVQNLLDGREEEALERYRALAAEEPDSAVIAAMVEILQRKISARCQAGGTREGLCRP